MEVAEIKKYARRDVVFDNEIPPRKAIASFRGGVKVTVIALQNQYIHYSENWSKFSNQQSAMTSRDVRLAAFSAANLEILTKDDGERNRLFQRMLFVYSTTYRLVSRKKSIYCIF